MRTMAPWQANEWFDNPATGYSEITLTGVNPERVAEANPMRVGIAFAIALAGVGITSVAPSDKLGPNGGYLLGTNVQPAMFTHAQWGPYVACEWFCNGSAGQVLTVMELIMHDWPQPDPHDNLDIADLIETMLDRMASLEKAVGDARRDEVQPSILDNYRIGPKTLWPKPVP